MSTAWRHRAALLQTPCMSQVRNHFTFSSPSHMPASSLLRHLPAALQNSLLNSNITWSIYKQTNTDTRNRLYPRKPPTFPKTSSSFILHVKLISHQSDNGIFLCFLGSYFKPWLPRLFTLLPISSMFHHLLGYPTLLLFPAVKPKTVLPSTDIGASQRSFSRLSTQQF